MAVRPSAKDGKTRGARRARRSPEEARTLILDAADRVFARALPDAVGLKEIAREAGVSHALVTHYFGTYGGMVEAALERRFARVRESLVNQLRFVLDPHATVRELLATYRAAIAEEAAEPVTVRLATWAMMSGRTGHEDFFAHRVQGLRILADALEARTQVPREDLEFCLISSFAMTVMWTVGGTTLSRALGKTRLTENDRAFEDRVAVMIDAYLTARGHGQTPGTPS